MQEKKYLIYQIQNLIDGRIYIGAHSTKDPNDKYMGSSKYLTKDIKLLGKENFKKTILFIFDNKEDMIDKEAEIVDKNFCMNTNTYNRYPGGLKTSFSKIDMICAKDKLGNFILIFKEDPRFTSGELVGVSKGMVPVKDKDGNIFKVSKDDIRYLSGELVHNAKGTITVKDKDGNIFKVSKDDIRYLSGELVGIMKGVKHKHKTKRKPMSEERKILHSNRMKGKKHTEETKKKMSLSKKGSKLSEERKKKISLLKKKDLSFQKNTKRK